MDILGNGERADVPALCEEFFDMEGTIGMANISKSALCVPTVTTTSSGDGSGKENITVNVDCNCGCEGGGGSGGGGGKPEPPVHLGTQMTEVVIDVADVHIPSLAANTYYNCITGITSLTVDSIPISLDETIIEFTTGDVVPSLNFPADTRWLNGAPLVVTANMRFSIAILRGLVAYGRFSR